MKAVKSDAPTYEVGYSGNEQFLFLNSADSSPPLEDPVV
jgi:hypothetical protein